MGASKIEITGPLHPKGGGTRLVIDGQDVSHNVTSAVLRLGQDGSRILDVQYVVDDQSVEIDGLVRWRQLETEIQARVRDAFEEFLRQTDPDLYAQWLSGEIAE